MIAALELDGRFARAGHAIAYLAVTLPVTLLALPAVAALILGAALSVAGIGLPLLLAAATFCRSLERLDRRAANRWLGAQVPPLHRLRPSRFARADAAGGAFRRSLYLLSRPLAVAHRDPPGAAAAAASPRCSSSRSLPVFVFALLLQLGHRRARGRRRRRLRRPVDAGRRASALVLCALALPAARARPGRAGDALPRPRRQLARAAGPAHGAGRAGAGDAGREPRRPHGHGRLLAARPRALRGRARAARSSCRSPARAGRGPRSTATASGSRRSSTTPRWTPRPSW